MTDVALYQTIHLNRGRARLLQEHIAELDSASRELFNRPYTPDPHGLEAALVRCATAANYPSAVSGFVRLELTPEGAERLLPAGVSLYDGYALRSLHPVAVTLGYDLALSGAPTPAREATTALARCLAELQGASAAIQRTSCGVLLSADDAPLYGLYRDTVFHAPFPSALQAPACAAIAAAGYRLSSEPLLSDYLSSLDELFWIDHRGITSAASCDGFALMSLAAERIATELEAQFQKR